MSVTVRVPTPLRRYTHGQAQVTAEGATLTEVVADLEARYAGLRERLLDEEGNLRRFVNVFVNDEDVRFQGGLTAAVNDGDEVSIVPAIAGGGVMGIRQLGN
jgi:MoaD family protein